MTGSQDKPDPRVTAAREELRAKAAKMGIDPSYVSCLVDNFYNRVRSHVTLGPIFNDAISDWDAHLATMKKFWASIMLSSGEYSGKPVLAHRKHIDVISRDDFAVWLTLFRETLDDTAPTPEARDHFMARAERIAQSLQLAMFGTESLGAPNYG